MKSHMNVMISYAATRLHSVCNLPYNNFINTASTGNFEAGAKLHGLHVIRDLALMFLGTGLKLRNYLFILYRLPKQDEIMSSGLFWC